MGACVRIKYVTKLEFELLLAEQELNRQYVTYSGMPKPDKILVVDNQGICQIMPAPTELIEVLI